MTTLACARRALPALAAALVLTGCTAGTATSGGPFSPGTTPSTSAPSKASAAPSHAAPSATADRSVPAGSAAPAPATVSATPRTTASPGTSAHAGGLTVHVTYSGRTGASIEVAGFVETLDAGGMCLAEAIGAGKSTQVTGQATPDASTVSCGTIDIPSTGLGAGPWTIRLGYELGGAESWSSTVKVTP